RHLDCGFCLLSRLPHCFLFQAEDGIRDRNVTGVQTCALPIFIQSMATKPVVILTIIIMGIGVYLPYSTVGKSMGFVPLPGSYFLWLIAILIGYAGLIQISKRFYIKKFGSWI